MITNDNHVDFIISLSLEEKKSLLYNELKTMSKIYSKIVTNNPYIDGFISATRIINIVNDYNKNLKETNSHSKSLIITASEFFSAKMYQTIGFSCAFYVGNIVASSGFYSLPACFLGAGTTAVIIVASVSTTDDVKSCTKIIVKKTVDLTQKITKKVVPIYVREMIYNCINKPVEQRLKLTYNFCSETINKITHEISSTLYNSWEKIHPEKNTICCKDTDGKIISIDLNKNISTKIYNYCKVGSNCYFPNDIFEQNNFIIGNKYNGTSKFEQTTFNNSTDLNLKISKSCKSLKQFNNSTYSFPSNFMDFTNSLNSIDFLKNDPILTSMHKINSHSIPNYIYNSPDANYKYQSNGIGGGGKIHVNINARFDIY